MPLASGVACYARQRRRRVDGLYLAHINEVFLNNADASGIERGSLAVKVVGQRQAQILRKHHPAAKPAKAACRQVGVIRLSLLIDAYGVLEVLAEVPGHDLRLDILGRSVNDSDASQATAVQVGK